MKSLRLITVLTVLTVASAAAQAQFDFSSLSGGAATTPAPQAPQKTAWEQFKLNPKTKVKLDFRNASVDAITQLLSQASGIAIIKDPALTGGLTLQSPTQQNLTDAFSMFNVVLGMKNYELVKNGNFLVIQQKQGGGGGFPSAASNFFSQMTGGGGGGSRATEVKVYVIKYASATALAKVINDLYSTTTGTTDLATLLQGAAGANGAAGGRFGRGGGNQGGQNGNAAGGTNAIAQALSGQGGNGFGGRGQNNTPVVKASADDYSNSLIINAPSTQQDQIADIIDKIDRSTDQPQQSRVFKLQYVLASDLQNVVQNILTNTVPLGRAASATRTTTSQPRNPFFGGPATTSTSAGAVAVDTKSNSLVVTTTPDILEHVAQVIATLDKPPAFQSTTFVYVMKNARADVVANLLNESFGNRTSNGPVGGSLSGAQTISSSTSSSSGPASLTSTSNTSRNTNNNMTVTSQNSSSTTQATTGFDDSGHVINVRNLTGNVLLVPNIDTNSIICVALPEDRPLVEKILAEMDQIPEQVKIDTLVVEASLDKTDQLGVEWSFGDASLFGAHNANTSGQTYFGLPTSIIPGSTTTTTPTSGLSYTITAGQYKMFLNAAETDTRLNILSKPSIFTTNNAPAQINISQSIPYVLNSTFDATSSSTVYNYGYLDVGIVMTVTPRITSNGYVTMDVTQTANDLAGYSQLLNAPIVNQREAQSTVSVRDGETVVLGGIIQNQVTSTKNKVPLLGDLPLIGNLFRSNNTDNNKTELLVFMTPHVVHDSDEARALREQTENELGTTTRQMIPQATAPKTSGASKPASTTPAGGSGTASTPVVIPPPIVTVSNPAVAPAPTASTIAPVSAIASPAAATPVASDPAPTSAPGAQQAVPGVSATTPPTVATPQPSPAPAP